MTKENKIEDIIKHLVSCVPISSYSNDSGSIMAKVGKVSYKIEPNITNYPSLYIKKSCCPSLPWVFVATDVRLDEVYRSVKKHYKAQRDKFNDSMIDGVWEIIKDIENKT